MCKKLILVGVVWILAAFFPVWAQQPAPVAKVAVAVGETRKVNASGQVEALQVGSSLWPGERIRTGPDAVAILVFSDEGRMSIRADSELLIRHYEIDPAGTRTRIELELIKGTVRQISGNASRAQPERYRLNTPIAVIGVRGTDFLAKTSGDAVEAFVHEGNIILVPNAETCARGSLSSCDPVAMASSASGSRYVRLSAAGQVETREFRPGELERVFGIETARAGRPGNAVGLAQAPGEFKLPANTQFITETIFVAYGSDAQRLPVPPYAPPAAAVPSGPMPPAGPAPTVPSTSSPAAGPDPAPAPAPAPTPPVTSPTAPPVDANPAPATPTPPAAPVVALAPLPTQLIWGRFTSASALPAALTTSFAEASQGRHVTVGELGQYALWRADPSGPLDPSLKGKADFALACAEAVLVQPSGVSSARVDKAFLQVDFDLSTFAAAVSLQHETAGAASLSVNGKVNVEGVFVGTNATERVAGAISRDGKEAGYLFSKDVSAGTFRGITLWGRK